MPKKLLKTWSSLWKIRSHLSKRLYSLMVVLSISLPLLAWTLLTGSGLVDSQFLPSPMAVMLRGYASLQSGELISDLIASLSRVIWGFLASAILSIPLGLLIGTFKSIEGLLEPILGLLRYMPTAAFIPLIILWIGIDESAKIAIIFLGTFFYNVLMIADAVKFIPNDLIKVSYTLGAKEKDVFFDIIFPATLPNIIDTLRINIATAWNFVVIAELIAASSGLGYRILMAQRAYQTDAIFVGIIVIGFIGLLIDFSFKLLFRVLVPWAIEPNH